MTTTEAPTVIWQPQAGSQEAFLACDDFEVLYEGPRGNGKTDPLIADYLRDVGKGWGSHWSGYLFRHTYRMLDEIVQRCHRMIPPSFPGARFNASDFEWHFPAGEILRLRQLNHEGDYQKVQGHEAPWIGVDEAGNFADPGLLLKTQASCRSSVPGIPKRFRMNANPHGVGHDWLCERFALPIPPGHIVGPLIKNEGEPGRRAIHGDISENRILLEADPQYIERLRSACDTEDQWNAWRWGSWLIRAGGRFGWLWDRGTHIVEPFEIPRSWRIDRSYDDGESSPFACIWWAESNGEDYTSADGQTHSTVAGDLFAVAEWYGFNGRKNEGLDLIAPDIAKGIIEREIGWGLYGRVCPGPADTSLWRRFNTTSRGALMAQHVRIQGRQLPGVQWTRAEKGPGSRVLMWSMLSERLKGSKPSETGIRERPGLFVFNTCEQWLRTVPSVPRCPKNADDVATDSEDHMADATGYRMLVGTTKPGFTRTSMI